MNKTKVEGSHNTKAIPPNNVPNSNVLRKSVFDTKNYYYYFTEVERDNSAK